MEMSIIFLISIVLCIKFLFLSYFMHVPNYGFTKKPKRVARFGQQIIDWKYSWDWRSIYSYIDASQRDTSYIHASQRDTSYIHASQRDTSYIHASQRDTSYIHASQRDTSRWDESISLGCGFSSGLLWTRNEVPAPVKGEKYLN
jgi:hypothetical protein